MLLHTNKYKVQHEGKTAEGENSSMLLGTVQIQQYCVLPNVDGKKQKRCFTSGLTSLTPRQNAQRG